MLALATLLTQVSLAVTITDNFATATNWGSILSKGGGNISVGSGRMNYTAATTANSGAVIPRNTLLLLTTQDWSLKVDAHLNATTITTEGQFSDVFLGFGKTGDYVNTHVSFEFGRGYWGNPNHKGYYVEDNVRINGIDAPVLFMDWDVISPDVALRIDYSAANHTVIYYFDADGATGGYAWVAQGAANLASGTYDLGLGAADTFTVFLIGSSEGQTVAAGQAYLSNLEITVGTVSHPPVVTTGTATAIDSSSATVNGTVNPNGLATSARFEYGLTTNYGNTASVALSSSDGVTAQTASATLTGLSSGTTYHYRLTALNSGGAGTGWDATFTTASSPFTWTTNNGTITITGYKGPGGVETIPGIIHGLPVTSIGYGAFSSCKSLTSITMPNSVTGIEEYAFYSCTSLTNILMPNSVTSIEEYAFYSCTSLTDITIPHSVTSIGVWAFHYCTSLGAITVDAQNSVYSSLAGVLLNKSQTTLIQWPEGKAGSYTIPTSVESIGDYAFSSCTNLTSVTIGNSVTNVGDYAFEDCYYLTSATIGNGVTNIGSYVFAGCRSLINVTIGNSVTSIGHEAFHNCDSLTSVTIPDSVISIGREAFWDCDSLTSVTLGNGVTSIGDFVFAWCTSLTHITIPQSVTSIGATAFNHCYSLTSATIPNSVTSIGDGAFSSCTSLTNITVEALNSVYCSRDGVLFNKSATTLIECPGGKTGIYNIPDGVTSIGDGAFYYCFSLTSITMPNSVTSIGSDAFSFCTSLTDITIPNSVTSIGRRAFYYCPSLGGIFFQGNAPDFSFDPANATVYYLPGTTGWGATFGGRPTALWKPQIQTSDASFGEKTNQFGFNINWASGHPVVVDACTNLVSPDWQPVQTNTLTSGSYYFSDPQWTNYPGRFYRLRSL